MKKVIYLILLSITIFGCDNSMKIDGKKVIADLSFHKCETEKEFTDLILKAIKTNRDKVVFEQLGEYSIDSKELNKVISAYSQSIGSRDWELQEVESKENFANGVDYNWLDKKGRTAIQINIKSSQVNNSYILDRLEFRSRLDILPSFAFPGGEISDYKKIVNAQ